MVNKDFQYTGLVG